MYAIAGMIILNPDSDLHVIVPDMRAPDRELFLHCQNIFLGLVYLAFLAILIRYPELPLGPYVQTGLCFGLFVMQAYSLFLRLCFLQFHMLSYFFLCFVVYKICCIKFCLSIGPFLWFANFF